MLFTSWKLLESLIAVVLLSFLSNIIVVSIVHAVHYWDALLSDPSPGSDSQRFNLFRYLTDEIQFPNQTISFPTDGGRKSLTICASALSALLAELPNSPKHQPPEVVSTIITSTLRNLITLFLYDSNSQRIMVSSFSYSF